MEDTTDRVLTSEEAAAYLKVSARTFETLRKAGEAPPGSKVGRQWRYRREALDRWLAEREQRADGDS
jgi:excisionase family DNA binding protein